MFKLRYLVVDPITAQLPNRAYDRLGSSFRLATLVGGKTITFSGEYLFSCPLWNISMQITVRLSQYVITCLALRLLFTVHGIYTPILPFQDEKIHMFIKALKINRPLSV